MIVDMKKGSPAVVLAFASLALAADFWVTKPATDWNEKEAKRIITVKSYGYRFADDGN